MLAEDLEGAVLELRNLSFSRRNRTRCFSRLPRQMFFACCLAERAPNGHRPLAWPFDSAVRVEAGFTGQFPSASLVWIMPGHVGLSTPHLGLDNGEMLIPLFGLQAVSGIAGTDVGETAHS